MHKIQPTNQNISSVWAIDGTLTITTILGESELGSYGNDGLLHHPQSTRTKENSL